MKKAVGFVRAAAFFDVIHRPTAFERPLDIFYRGSTAVVAGRCSSIHVCIVKLARREDV